MASTTGAGQRSITPIKVTVRRPAFRTGRMEIWAAESQDSMWSFERTDEPGTPWSVTRAGYDGFVLAGSLLSGRRITASGYALGQLERQQAQMAA